MKLPVPSRRTLGVMAGATLVIAVAFVTFLVYVVITTSLASADKDEQLERSGDRLDRALSFIKVDERRDVRERRQASRERRIIAENVDDLLAYTRQLAQRQARMLAYFERNGIEVPPRFLTPVPAPTLTDPTPPQGPTQRPPSGTRDRSPDRNGNGQQNGSNGGNGGNRPPRNDGPGNSENAPGRNKGKKHKKPKGGGKGHKPKPLVTVPDPDEVAEDPQGSVQDYLDTFTVRLV